MFTAFLSVFSRPGIHTELDDLEIRKWHTARAVIVRVFGGLWSTNIDQLREAMADLLGQSKPIVVVDLTGVTFIGSQGISALWQVGHELNFVGIEMRVVAPPSHVRDIFETTLIHRVLNVHETVADALHAARGLAGATRTSR